MPRDEKLGARLPAPEEVVETLDAITSEARTLRKKIKTPLASSERKTRLAATNDPPEKKPSKRLRAGKKR